MELLLIILGTFLSAAIVMMLVDRLRGGGFEEDEDGAE
jgi:heme/copper-type cytochrome/quinol oxidase subunit 1